MQRALGSTDPVMTALQAIHGGNFPVNAKDVAGLRIDGVRRVGQVGYRVKVGEVCWSHVTFWTHVHGFMYRVSDDCVLLETKHVQNTCAYSLKGTDAIVILP